MTERHEPLHEVFRPPRAGAGPERGGAEAGASFDPLVVRLHLAALTLALVVFGGVTAFMLLERLDPQPTLDPMIHTAVVGTHAFAPYMLVLPVLLGLVPMLVLPGTVGVRSPRPTWLAYVGLIAWCGGLGLSVMGQAASVLERPLGWWGVQVILLAIGVYAVGLVLAVISGGRALLRRAAILCLSLLATAVGSVLLVAVVALVLAFGAPENALYTPDHLSIALPPLLCLITVLVERREGVALFTGIFPWALLGTCIVAWLPLSPWTVLLVPLALPVVIRIFPRVVARLSDPASLSLLAALLAVEVAVLARAILAIAVDDAPNVFGTYLLTVPTHLVSEAVLLVLLSACLEHAPVILRREPRRGLAIAGVVGLGAGLATSAAAMLVIGQHEQPLYLQAYEPRFEALQQQVGVGGAIAAAGLVLVVLAIATGRRASTQ